MVSALILPVGRHVERREPRTCRALVGEGRVRGGGSQRWEGMEGATLFRRWYAVRIRTGCVYDPQPRGTYSVQLMQSPRFAQRTCHYTEWCPGLAPRTVLLEAYTTGHHSWQLFAARYLADLNAHRGVLPEVRARVARLLPCYPALAVLGAVGGDGRRAGRDEAQVRYQRRVFRAWLLGDPVPDLLVALPMPSPHAASSLLSLSLNSSRGGLRRLPHSVAGGDDGR